MDRSSSVICCLIAFASCFHMISCNITCLHHERDALLSFMNKLDPAFLLHSWQGFNCCEWRGVECSSHTSNVVKLHHSRHRWSDERNSTLLTDLFQLKRLQHLDLSSNSLSGVLPKGLFALKELRHLDLSRNYFEGEIPKQFASLHNLAYLNLSRARFNGTIPYQLGNLSQLEFLDLSVAEVDDIGIFFYGEMHSPSLVWTEKLQKLKYLSLSGVVLDMTGKQLEASLSHLYNLQQLHLLGCMLSGHIPNAIQNLSFLTHLHLGYNNFEGSVPLWLGNLTTLVSLWFNECPLLSGLFPLSLSRLPTLKEFTLTGENLISGNLSQILCGEWSQLNVLSLSRSNMKGSMPPCIANISSLIYLNLGDMKNVEGPIPSSIGNLSILQALVLDNNLLNGEIPPSLGKIQSLTYLYLSSNFLTGNIPSELGNLSSLVELDLSSNFLSGNIPSELGKLSSLKDLYLHSNLLSGNIPFQLGELSSLDFLRLSDNQLNGSIPISFGSLPSITSIYLSLNNLQGNLFLNVFENLTGLNSLDLSYNELTVIIKPDWVPTIYFDDLYLASCNIGGIVPPFLSTQYRLSHLDLSNNSLFGNIPDWLGMLPDLKSLNLSYNNLQGHVPSNLIIRDLWTIDLHSNMLQGALPFSSVPTSNMQLLDLSQNRFTGFISMDIGNLLPAIQFLSFSANDLSGDIPSSIGLLQWMEVLDLSNNKLFGKIPSSITNCSFLTRLNLANTGLMGEIPYHMGMLSELRSLHLDGNMLKGNLPSSLKNCSSLQILDLANNHFSGNIPSWLGQFSELMILVLRSNKFEGHIPHQLSNLSSLHVLDISHNGLIGYIPPQLAALKSMRNSTVGSSHGNDGSSYYYKEEIQVFNKGLEMVYVSSVMLLITCIDLSVNNLTGDIPSVIGNLKSLHTLNLSDNGLTGEIPRSFGLLTELESLDLSNNKLHGRIPNEMLQVSYLSFFIVSNNRLCGKIPEGRQFNTFNSTYFSGNRDLCGFPVNNKSCRCGERSNPSILTPLLKKEDDEGEGIPWHWYVEWMASVSIGFWGVFGILATKRNWRRRFIHVLDEMAISLLSRLTNR
ncbi:receptor-like protein 47 [Cryptomeria japonica]|uniref:receptor-like protein 47 n=1 Tax=Cryptomeria japonica TaxID=3369 RepID=UPI0027DA6D3B|nr:receptor-like protein 47 [Cryptomeria japonica]